MILVSMFDKKASSYSGPISFDSLASAIRSYVMFARQKPDALQVQFCEDYDLYDVGLFNQVSGKIDAVTPPNFIESMTAIVNQSRKELKDGQA